MERLRVSLVQTALAWADPPANRRAIAEAIAPLAGATDLVVLPEMFATGFTMTPHAHAEPADGPSLEWLRGQARELGAVITGSLAVLDDAGDYRNRLYWVTPDGHHTCYDKRHCFRMAGEHEWYRPGTQRLIARLHGWRICPLICYDLRFPVWSRNHDDYDLLLYVANWPAVRRSSWQRLLPARAIENLAPVVGVNRVGEDANGRAYAGDSMVLDWLGEPLMTAGGDEQVATAVLEPTQLQRYRRKFPAHHDADGFTLTDPALAPTRLWPDD